nr:DUF4383 domain-containing protein [Mycobacterium sp. E2238]
MDPRRFRSGRWLLLGEGVLVTAFGIAGLISAALHPHAVPTGTPVLGLALTPAQSAILLTLGVLAIAAVGNRRAAVTVTALSAVAYLLLLFFSSVATARTVPTPLGFHAADIVLHGDRRASSVDDEARFGVGSWLRGIVDRHVQVTSRRHSETDESVRGLAVVKAARLQRGHLVEPLVVDRKRRRLGRFVGMGPWLIATAVSGKYVAVVELEERVGRPGDSQFHHAA